MIKPTFHLKTFPTRLLAIHIDPVDFIYSLFRFIKPPVNDVKLIVYGSSMILSRFHVMAAGLYDFPAVFGGRIGR